MPSTVDVKLSDEERLRVLTVVALHPGSRLLDVRRLARLPETASRRALHELSQEGRIERIPHTMGWRAVEAS